MKNIYKQMNIIGSDETGVGDYLTPLVAAAVFVPFKNVIKLENMGVIDSKKLTNKKIIKLANKIKPFINYSVKHLNQIKYNKLNSNLNANELKMFLHLEAINNLETQIQNVNLIIIDQFSNPTSINNYYNKLIKLFGFKKFKANLKLVKNGEAEHIAVAAASIIARAWFLQLIQNQNKKWDMTFPLGTNQIVENFAIKFVKKYGRKNLKKIAKISFKTTKKLFD